MNYLVYKHTSPSGKSYIGITDNYDARCVKHQHPSSGCAAFYAAICKYGWDNFTHTIIADNLTIIEANRLEMQLITELNTQAPNGYNLREGGNAGGKHHTTTKQKISDALTGRSLTEDHKRKISSSKAGKTISAETLIKRNLTRERNKEAGIVYGHTCSDTTKNIISKDWIVTAPDGSVTIIRNLTEFCRQNNLARVGMMDVANGKQKQHRGWKCSRYNAA